MVNLAITDQRLAMLIRRVVLVSVITAFLAVAMNVYCYVNGSDFSSQSNVGDPGTIRLGQSVGLAVGVGAAIFVPACGFFGARKSNRCLTCCFCGWSLVGCFTGVALAGFLVFVLLAVKARADDCLLSMPMDQASDIYQACLAIWRLEDRVGGIGAAVVALLALTALLQCLGHLWGQELHTALKQGQVLHQVLGEPVITPQLPQPYSPDAPVLLGTNGQAGCPHRLPLDMEHASPAAGKVVIGRPSGELGVVPSAIHV